MVHRHETEVFPLMRRRHLFSGAENFALYDFIVPEGWVDENVFAFSNRRGDERALILYNNAYNTTVGHIHTSTAINIGDAEHKTLVRRSLAEALALNSAEHCYYVFRDHRTGLEYVRKGRQLAEEGLHVQLHAYQYHAFLHFREVEDRDGSWGRLATSLGDSGVPSIDEAYEDLFYAPVLEPLRRVVSADMLRVLAQPESPRIRTEFEPALCTFFDAAARFTGVEVKGVETPQAILSDFGALDLFHARLEEAPLPKPVAEALRACAPRSHGPQSALWRVAAARILLHGIGEVAPIGEFQGCRRDIIPSRLLRKATVEAFKALGVDDWDANMEVLLATLLVEYAALIAAPAKKSRVAALKKLLDDPVAQAYLEVNRHQDVLWLRKESLESLVHHLLFVAALGRIDDPGRGAKAIARYHAHAHALLRAAEAAGYRLATTLELVAS